MSRRVFQADALAWMDANPPEPNASVVTSLPDVSELTQYDLAGWRTFFVAAARRVIRWVPPEGVAIFYQSDIRVAGALVDKGYLVVRAAEEEGASLLWHKIVCRKPPGFIAHGRSSYSHMIAVTRGPIPPMRAPGPEVLPDAGEMRWSRAMGATACRVACRYLLDNTPTRVVVDPFFGRGTVLAVANELGLDAIGVDISKGRCRAARAMSLERRIESARDALLRGAALFDRGDHFEAHEAWEDRWRAATDRDERLLFQGLVQIAAAFHKLFAKNAREPAVRLLGKALPKLDAVPDLARELRLEAFVERVRACQRAMTEGTLARDQVPRIGE